MIDNDSEVAEATAAVDDYIDRAVMSARGYRLIGMALELSEAKTWARAKYEWAVVSCDDNEWADETCVCGYDGIRYLNTVTNSVTGESLYPVGSCCVERFDNDEMKEQMKDLKAIAALRKAARAGALTYKSFNRRVIDGLHRQGVIGDVAHTHLRRGATTARRGHGRVEDEKLRLMVARIVQTVVVPYLMAEAADDEKRTVSE